MEWNWLSGNNNNMTPFFLFESTGDSEDQVKLSHVHEEEDEAAMDEQEGVLFRFSHDHQDDDDDAQSCSYDHSSYNKTDDIGYDHESQRLISNDDVDDDDGDGEIEDDEDDDKNKNQCQSKLICSSKQQWRSNCVHDPSNQRESDRKFWEACLAS